MSHLDGPGPKTPTASAGQPRSTASPDGPAAKKAAPETAAGVILVAEDDEIVAMDVEDELHDLGFEVAGPFPTCEALTAWLADATPAAAVLDLHLRDGSCRASIEILRSRGVPTILCSGSRDEAPAGIETDLRLDKPYDIARLGRLVARLLRPA